MLAVWEFYLRSLDKVTPNNFTTVTTSTFLLLIIIGSKNLLDVEKLILNSLHLVSFSSVPFAMDLSANTFTWL